MMMRLNSRSCGLVAILSVLFMFLSCLSLAADSDTESSVRLVGADLLFDVLDDRDHVLVLWTTKHQPCAQCTFGEEVMNEMATDEKFADVELLQVDCHVEKELCERHGITQYPGVIFFTEGYGVYRFSSFDFEQLPEFVAARMGPKFTEFTSLSDIEHAVTENMELVVGFFETKDCDEYQNFVATTYQLFEQFPFGTFIIDDVEAFQESDMVQENEQHFSQLPAVIAFKQTFRGAKVFHFMGRFSRRLLREWMLDTIHSHLTEVKQSLSKYLSSHATAVIAFLDYQANNFQETLLLLEDLAEGFRQCRFLYTEKSLHAEELSFLGAEKWDGSVILAFDSVKRENYLYTDESFQFVDLDYYGLAEFLEAVVEGKWRPFVQREEIPIHRTGSVEHLVYDTYYDAVHEEELQTVVLYYLSSCKYSSEFREIYHKVADEFVDVPFMTMAEIDLDKNQRPPGARVNNFPSIRIHTQGATSQQIPFFGRRTFEDLHAFLIENVPGLAEYVVGNVDVTAQDEAAANPAFGTAQD